MPYISTFGLGNSGFSFEGAFICKGTLKYYLFTVNKMNTNGTKNTILPNSPRIKCHHGHFLAEIVYDKSKGYILRVYCKRCKEFHEIEMSKFQNTDA